MKPKTQSQGLIHCTGLTDLLGERSSNFMKYIDGSIRVWTSQMDSINEFNLSDPWTQLIYLVSANEATKSVISLPFLSDKVAK